MPRICSRNEEKEITEGEEISRSRPEAAKSRGKQTLLSVTDFSHFCEQVTASAKEVRDSVKAACVRFTLHICTLFQPYFQ